MAVKYDVSPLLSLGLLLFFALTLGSILNTLGFPAILGYFTAGYLLGPAVFGIVQPSETLWVFAELGFILLLFFAGLEFSIKKLTKSGSLALILSPVKSGIGFLLGYTFMVLLGYPHEIAVVAGAAVAVSSTSIILSRLMDRKQLTSIEGRTALSMLLLEDVFSVVFITYMLSTGQTVTETLLHIFLVLILILTLGSNFSRKVFSVINTITDRSTFPLFSLGFLVLFSYTLALLNIPSSLGAFFAGVILSEVLTKGVLERELSMVRKLFTVIFFTSIPLFYPPVFNEEAFTISIFLLISQFLAVFVASVVGAVIGMPIRSAVRFLYIDLPIGEFSMFFASTAAAKGIEGSATLLGAVFLTMIYTVLLSRFIEMKEDRLVTLYRKWISVRLPPVHKTFVERPEQRNVVSDMMINLLASLSITYVSVYITAYVNEQFGPMFALLSLPFLYNIYKDLNKLLSSFLRAQMFRHVIQSKDREKIYRTVEVLSSSLIFLILSLLVAVFSRVFFIPGLKELSLLMLFFGIVAVAVSIVRVIKGE